MTCPDANGRCGWEECREPDAHGTIGSCYGQGFHGFECPKNETKISCKAWENCGGGQTAEAIIDALPMSENPPGLDGDSPCEICGTMLNPVWYTDNTFWNSVLEGNREATLSQILCVNCFIVQAHKKYDVQRWRLLPEFKWNKKK